MHIEILLIAMTLLMCFFILFGIRVFLQFLDSRENQIHGEVDYQSRDVSYEEV